VWRWAPGLFAPLASSLEIKVKTRLFPRLIAALVIACTLSTAPAWADSSGDAAANQKIDEAVNNHYLMMELDKAESSLKGVVQSCGDKCSPSTVAKAWMYIGIVRGSGKNDLSGASEAFATAQSIDPAVKLDRDLASPETQATFDSLTGTAPPANSKPDSEPEGPPPVVAPGNVPGDMRCALESGANIATRMPIPMSCASEADTESAVLKFKEYGSKDWKKIELTKKGDAYEGTIPCDVTAKAGPLEWFVGAKNAAGEYVDQYGSKKEPATFNMSESGETELTFSDGTPAVRCTAASDCPPDFPGCGGPKGGAECGNLEWGAACKESSECQCGMLCESGTCNNAPSCTTNEECSTGFCDGGYCAAPKSGTKGPFKRHNLSLSFAADVVTYGGELLCREDRQVELSTICVNASGQLVPDAITPPVDGFVVSQFRALLGYDFSITDRIQVGARAGYIIGGNPRQFLPVHLEARGTFQFFSLTRPGIRAGAYLGVGLGDMDFRFAPLPSQAAGDLVVYKQGGNLFANVGASIGYAFTPNLTALLSGAAVITFPTTNFGLQPSLSVAYGF
jgi:hypothetical protein